MIYSLKDKTPSIHGSCFIAPSAAIIGDVVLKKNASVWFNCTIRADNDTITIGENTNIQDGSVLHVDPGCPINIAPNCTIGHKVMLHGCTIEENSLVGINAVILNHAKIGKNCIIGANALVTEGTEIPDGSMALGSPAKVVKSLPEEAIKLLAEGAKHYVDNSALFAEHLKPID